MIYDDKDACMVNMFEAFLESAPQLTLQAYVVITEYDAEKDNLLRTYQHLNCITLFPTKYPLQIALYVKLFYTLKLYCGYKNTRPCMINRIWVLKTTMTTCELFCLMPFAWLRWAVRNGGGSEKFKMKIFVSSRIRIQAMPLHDRWISALDRSAMLPDDEL